MATNRRPQTRKPAKSKRTSYDKPEKRIKGNTQSRSAAKSEWKRGI